MFSTIVQLLTCTLAASAALIPHKPRQVESNDSGVIAEPTSSTTITAGQSFPFDYETNNWCHDGYSAIWVYLTDYQPTDANVNSNSGALSPYSYTYGEYLVPNFGLPPMSNPSPEPSSLTTPNLSSEGVSPGPIWLSVVEESTECPPDGLSPPQYALTVVQLVYAQ